MKLKKWWISWGFLGWVGTGGDEYGRKTYYAGIYGLGAVVVAGQYFTYDEILNDGWLCSPELAEIYTRQMMKRFALERRIAGVEPPLEGEPDFSKMTYDEVLDWQFPTFEQLTEEDQK